MHCGEQDRGKTQRFENGANLLAFGPQGSDLRLIGLGIDKFTNFLDDVGLFGADLPIFAVRGRHFDSV
jgi:hypothetical protein